jgi:hypothetical protein
MNINTILKPHPHCPIPCGHPCYRGYVPATQTDIRQTWARIAKQELADDYDRVMRDDWLSAPGGWRA